MRALLALLLLLLPVAALAQRPLIAGKVYVGGNGERATVAYVKPATDNRCVVVVTGTTLEVDGLVFPCTTVSNDRRTDWFVTRQGRERTLVQTMPDGSAVLYLDRGEAHLRYADAETQKLDLEALWARHQKDKAACAAEARFDRAAETVVAERELLASVAPTDEACGTKLQVTLDLKAMPDEEFKANVVEAYCTEVLSQLQTFCERWKVARQTVAQRLTRVRCTFEGDLGTRFSVDGQQLNFRWGGSRGLSTWDVEGFLSEAL